MEKNHVSEQPASSSVAFIYKSLGVRFLSPDIQHRSEIELYHGTTKITLIKNRSIKNKFNKVKGSNPK